MTSDDRVNPPTGQRPPAPSGRADRTISIRLTEAELAELDARIARLGLKRNRALRIAARRMMDLAQRREDGLRRLEEARR